MPGENKIYTAGEKEYLTWLERKDKGVSLNKRVQEDVLAMRDEQNLKQYSFDFE
jgi:L-2-hydroxycarboxylate dehydrogenase (NAD+)